MHFLDPCSSYVVHDYSQIEGSYGFGASWGTEGGDGVGLFCYLLGQSESVGEGFLNGSGQGEPVGQR